MTPWSLKRTRQCAHCPWRTDVDPFDIPNGYEVAKHAALASTIAAPGAYDVPAEAPLPVMTCHETAQAYCVGWLWHQLGPGNNIRLRLRFLTCTNAHRLQVVGEQHATFAATLPASCGSLTLMNHERSDP